MDSNALSITEAANISNNADATEITVPRFFSLKIRQSKKKHKIFFSFFPSIAMSSSKNSKWIQFYIKIWRP